MKNKNTSKKSNENKIKITIKTKTHTLIKLAPPCSCNGCSNGCNYSGGILADNDIEPLAKFLNISVEELKKKHLDEIERYNTKKYRTKFKKNDKGFGRCNFYKNNVCTIHPAKPLQCKVATSCKEHGQDAIVWFHLNHFVNKNDPESIRQWAQYLKFNKTIPGGELKDLVKNKDKLKKILSYEILR